MRNISICDISVRRSEAFAGTPLPFRIKIEVAKSLSKIGVSAIEAAPIQNNKTDYFLVKSLAAALPDTVVAVPIDILDPDSLDRTWEALKDARKPRLQVPVPVSTVQMEYFCHKKPAGILDVISEKIAACAAICPDVEFVAVDFGRGEHEFLMTAIQTAIAAGANIVTVADVAGNLLPDEFCTTIMNIRKGIPENVKLGVYCSNNLYLAEASAVASVVAGVDEIKTMVFGNETVSLEKITKIISEKSDKCGVECSVEHTSIQQTVDQINRLCEVCVTKSPTAVSVQNSGNDTIMISANDDLETVMKVVNKLGYDLDRDDSLKVYAALMRLSSGNDVIAAKEIDAVVASVAFQVPVTYHLESFVINTGNIINPTCHIRLRKSESILEDVCIGDGPVDAAFMAVDRAIGKHYELDDFQVRAVTEGREALGETIVRLRNDGRLYSGRGVSKDIVESSLIAYINAINKIAYEEEQ